MTTTTAEEVDAAFSAADAGSAPKADPNAAIREVVGDTPLMEDPEVTTVTLPRGLFRSPGVWETEAEVRELTGADEEMLAKYKTLSDFFGAVAALGTSRIGSVQLGELGLAERFSIMETLLTGERQMLLVAIAAASFGDTQDMNGTCQNPACSKQIEFTIQLMEDLKPIIPDGCADPLPPYTLRDGREVELRLATGADEKLMLTKSTLAEQMTCLLSQLVVRVGGTPVVSPEGFARNLPVRDRQGLLGVIDQYQPKIDMEIELQCPHCHEKNLFTLGWQDLFRW